MSPRDGRASSAGQLAELNVIVLHLGNGASASAVPAGRCVDTSMGMTPLEGLVMGTRSGDLDPAVILYLCRAEGLSLDEIDTLLNRRSGMLGLCGDNDMRAVQKRVAAGRPGRRTGPRRSTATGSANTSAPTTPCSARVDVIAFTGGVGENSAPVRESGAGRSGGARHRRGPRTQRRGESLISPDGAVVKVAVIPTDEEFEIARQTLEIVSRTNSE